MTFLCFFCSKLEFNVNQLKLQVGDQKRVLEAGWRRELNQHGLAACPRPSYAQWQSS